MIRVIEDHREKYITRPLYEETFDHDGKGFVDYYYEDRCFDNKILVDEEADENGELQVVSMVHLNPYRVSLENEVVDAYYIFAVATKKEFRHQGRMAALLKAAKEYAQENKICFFFLIPVDEAIYTPFGFETVCELERDKTIPYDTIRRDYDVFCVRDDDYLRRLRKETELAAKGETQELPAHSVIMAHIVNEAYFQTRYQVKNDKEALALLRAKRLLFSEEV